MYVNLIDEETNKRSIVAEANPVQQFINMGVYKTEFSGKKVSSAPPPQH